ncbi:general amidase GmdA [Aspergillus costaricaensis CBS 115574]|uniref:General amidase GmdA n=1 Tax=Aspergillus costaricaensis CBS 115574 TaxID=1448317 RepID=A0ACD1IKD6_9EURO|nr:general amidase GmdA [Aspergillus costaricaensis CBS 115574]RAK90490.1 general amidase GmdA [Aspergillus costaricaensis CBS 115574]
MHSETPSWQKAAQAKRQAILDAIPQKWRIQYDTLPIDVTGEFIQGYLTPREIEITEADAVVITSQTTSGSWSAVEVTEAFCHRAAIAHQLVNCLHEVFFEDAIRVAKELDEHLAATGKPKGPLHGLPVSLKDQFHVKGVDTTMGYVGWIGTYQGKKDDPRHRVTESELVRELRNLGAVLFCKTSVPVTLMSGETTNQIIGYTWNPKNRNLSSGGSSGGEGALLALRGSPAGFGTDIGGSVRIPASFNGIFGLRPCAGRIPYEGAANSIDGQNTILSVIGPLATSIGGLKLLFRAILSQEPWQYDPLSLPLPWREDIEGQTKKLITQKDSTASQLTFGIMRHDGRVKPQPSVKVAMDLMERILRDLGHQVIEWDPKLCREGQEIASETYDMDGGEDLLSHIALSGEAQIPQCSVEPVKHFNAREVAELNVQKREYQKKYLDYWNSTAKLTTTGRPVDAVICPTAPHAAVIPGKYRHTGYTTFINTLDYTSLVVPICCADKHLSSMNERSEFLNELDRKIYEEYDPEIYHGAPIGLQLFGRRLEEEKIIMIAEYLSEKVKVYTGQ